MAQEAQARYERQLDDAAGDPRKMNEAQGELTAGLVARVQAEVIRLREIIIETTASIIRLKVTLDEHLQEAAAGSHYTAPAEPPPHAREQRMLDLSTAAAEIMKSIMEEMQDMNAANIMSFQSTQLERCEESHKHMLAIASDLHIRMTSAERKVASLAPPTQEAQASDV